MTFEEKGFYWTLRRNATKHSYEQADEPTVSIQIMSGCWFTYYMFRDVYSQ